MRSPTEQSAFLEGFEAALGAVERELERTRLKKEAVERVKTALKLMRETIEGAEDERPVS
jgi:hypothetical protein